jgi:hypothetical protein
MHTAAPSALQVSASTITNVSVRPLTTAQASHWHHTYFCLLLFVPTLFLQVFSSAITNVFLSGLSTGQLASLLPPASHSLLLALVCFNFQQSDFVPAGVRLSHHQRVAVRPRTNAQASHRQNTHSAHAHLISNFCPAGVCLSHHQRLPVRPFTTAQSSRWHHSRPAPSAHA